MKNIFCRVLLLVLLTASLTAASLALRNLELPLGKMPAHLTYNTYDGKTGELLQTDNFVISRAPDYLVIKSTISGRLENKRLEQTSTTYYMISQDSLSVRSYAVRASLEGQPLYSTTADFDWASGLAKFDFHNYKDKKAEINIAKLTDKSVLMSDLTLYMMDLINKGTSNDKASVLMPNGKPITALIKIDYRPETIRLKTMSAAGYKAAVTFDLGVFSFLSPTLNFWFAADTPHLLLRFAGPGSGGKNVIQELETAPGQL